MYKMIVCDLDETLMNEDGSLSEKNAAAIQAATAKGVHFVPNSGRSYTSFQNDLAQMKLKDQPNEYSISYNGGLVLENQNNKPLIINAMPYAVGQRVFAAGVANHAAATHVYTQDVLYIYNPIKEDSDYLRNRGVSFQIIDDADFAQYGDNSVCFLLYLLCFFIFTFFK